ARGVRGERAAHRHRDQSARRNAWRHQQRRANCAARGDQADEQPAAPAADGDALRRADGDRHARAARSVPPAAVRADGRGDGRARAGRPLAALAGPVQRAGVILCPSRRYDIIADTMTRGGARGAARGSGAQDEGCDMPDPAESGTPPETAQRQPGATQPLTPSSGGETWATRAPSSTGDEDDKTAPGLAGTLSPSPGAGDVLAVTPVLVPGYEVL